jgi:hypothetical protein
MISNRVILGLLVVAGVFACSGATCVQDITTEPREAKLQTFKSAEALQADAGGGTAVRGRRRCGRSH